MKKVKFILGGIAAVIVIVIAISSVATVQAGHTGVVTRFGAVRNVSFAEGIHLKIPFVDNVIQVDNRVLKTEVNSSSASKDLQTVTSTISLNYRVVPDKSASLYKNVGKSFQDVIVNPAILECVKAVTAKFTAEQLITNRQMVGEQMREAVDEKISPFGLQIEVFNIINFEFSQEFNAAIEAKQTAQQNALKAEQDLARIKVEAEQKVAQAKAEAEAYRLKSVELTDEMLQMEWISKWDGKLPAVVSDGSNIMDIGSIVSSTEKAK